ncbi:AAA family ATPase [Pseudoduganella sp. FT26W]|uniref:AAA family ATPase n=1 Tax=Duganella aquatilis TaxID=2666082 RepID=A0A844D6I8_9BURK|nr:ATP-binding protein [Duganella aquatilis]MRW83736.1 AAA family ATPase [Duganella aquatilis]
MKNHLAVQARYTPQHLEKYKGNPLIEALPTLDSVSACIDAIEYLPPFNPEDRKLSLIERHQLLGNLVNLMIPLERHAELAIAIDSMLRNGYVGREPETAQRARRFQDMYDKQKAGVPFRQSATTRTPQISASLIGLSGMGKTTMVQRFLATYPQVIYHAETNIEQVTYLRVEMPSDGSSVKGLAHGILAELDRLIPDASYYEMYTDRGRIGAETLMRSVARLMHLHCVGLLVCDEVQNLANSHKGADTVMTELTSACNDLGLPILFIGTNKAAKVLTRDFRQARRSVASNIATWDRLLQFVESESVNEWEAFIEILWMYQWTERPVPFDAAFSRAMYFYSQGVIDIAIKLFAAAQGMAMNDGSEQISLAHIDQAFSKQMSLLAPMIEALRANDLTALARCEDIAPITMESIVDSAVRRARARTSPLVRTKSTHAEFVPSLAAGMTAMGMELDEALSSAQAIAAGDKVKTLAEGMSQAMADTKRPLPVARKKTEKAQTAQIIDFSDRPNDYRRAEQEARLHGTNVYDQMVKLGMAPRLEDLYDLS